MALNIRISLLKRKSSFKLMKFIVLSLVLILIFATSAYAKDNDVWSAPIFSADEINLQDSPAGLDETNPSRWITQVIDNTFHEWKEFDLYGDGFCILMIEPEYRWLDAEEARVLLQASNKWVEQAAGAAREEDNLYKSSNNECNSYTQEITSYENEITFNKIVGDDERERVPNVEVYPYNTIGMLREMDSGASGTGFLVAPNIILTNGHVVFDAENRNFRTNLDFAPGLYQTFGMAKAPYGRRSGMSGFLIDPDYLEALQSGASWEIDCQHDLGAIYIEKPFEEIATFVPLKYDYAPNDEIVYTSGYPKGGGFFEQKFKWAQYRSSGKASVLGRNERILAHLADVTGAQSGSPIWIECDETGRFFVIALATRGAYKGSYYGTRLVSENKSLIDKWMKWEPVKLVNLTASLSSPTAPGETISFTAQAEGGVDPEYRFGYRRVGGSRWTEARGYTANNSISFVPDTKHVGEFEFVILARSGGSNVDYEALDIIEHAIEKVAVAPVESVNLTVEPSSPTTPGERITLTAHATGGVDPEYRFGYRRVGSSKWTEARGYSANNSISFVPGTKHVGEFEFIVLAKSKGSTETYEAQDRTSHVVKEKDAEQEGFDINFSRSAGAQGWIGYPSSAWSLGTNELFTSGRTGKFTSAVYSDINFTNFDYSIRARRTDSVIAQYIFVRAGSEAKATSYMLYPGYLFGYSNAGYYSIWKINNDGSYLPPLQGWTITNAINRYGFNTLRVRAIGGIFQFYINGTLVNTITDYTFSRGMVGFTMGRTEDDPSTTRFEVDWAKLSPITGSSATLLEEKVSPEQEALNQEVIDSGVIGSLYGDW